MFHLQTLHAPLFSSIGVLFINYTWAGGKWFCVYGFLYYSVMFIWGLNNVAYVVIINWVLELKNTFRHWAYLSVEV
jgi:hypothetical protein